MSLTNIYVCVKQVPDTETRIRIEALRAKLTEHPTGADDLRTIRGITVLEGLGAPATRLLEKLAAGPPDARLTREADAAVKRMRTSGPGSRTGS